MFIEIEMMSFSLHIEAAKDAFISIFGKVRIERANSIFSTTLSQKYNFSYKSTLGGHSKQKLEGVKSWV